MYGLLADGINEQFAVLCCGACTHPAAEHPIDPANSQRYAKECLRYPDEITSSGYDYYLHSNGAYTVLEDYSGNPANIIELCDGVIEEFSTTPPISFDGVVLKDYGFSLSSPDSSHYRIEDSIDYYDNGEDYYNAINSWYDRDQKICTHAASYWHINLNTGEVVPQTPYGYRRMPKVLDPQSNKYIDAGFVESYEDKSDRNVYVEGLDGFTAQHWLDPDKTAKFHARLFNSFTHKRTGNFHVGSLAITVSNETVTATCINRECNIKHGDGNYRQASLTCSLDCTRHEMEDFVYQVIRHGNNHGPSFIVNRNTRYVEKYSLNSTVLKSEANQILVDFGLVPSVHATAPDTILNEFSIKDHYKLHYQDCDLNCNGVDDNGNPIMLITCNHNAPITQDTNLTDVEFVFEHQAWCSDKNCGCVEWLRQELPSLYSAVA